MARFSAASLVAVSADTLYRWHMRPGAFERLTPPWQPVRVLEREGSSDTPGARVVVSVPLGPIPWLRGRWVAVHHDIVPGRAFSDTQLAGPFARWEHRHRFLPQSADHCILQDAIDYRLPFHGLSSPIVGRSVRRELERMFEFRHTTTLKDVETHDRYQGRQKMKILITGASGLVGRELAALLETGGHEVVPLRRGPGGWDPEGGVLEPSLVEGFDGVVHLAGESIASGRWSEARKERIRASRANGTRLLADTLAALDTKPRVLVSASAIGYYGDRGDELLEASDSPGSGFLADVCQQWEAATEPAAEARIRVVRLRLGIVLSPKGGALQKMLTPFRLGVGGVIGDGSQYMSWISLDDVAGAILHALMTDTLDGAVNAVSPSPVTNREFTRVLGRVLRRPTILPLPSFAAKLALGEMADELLLSSAKVSAKKLVDSGYVFRQPELEGALRHVLGRVDR